MLSPSQTVGDIRRLGRNPEGPPRPVRLTGVVTYADPAESTFYLQDEIAGVQVRRPGSVRAYPGEQVTVDGTVQLASFPLEVDAHTITRHGTGELPDPVRCDLDRADSRRTDGQFVELWAVVLSIHPPNKDKQEKNLALRVSTAAGTGLVIVPDGDATEARSLRGAAVRARGVLQAGFDQNGAVAWDPTILCHTLPERVVGPGVDESIPVAHLADLRRFVPERPFAPRRVRVTGVVTAVRGKDTLLIQDETAGVVVRLLGNKQDLSPGTQVEVSGLLDIRDPRILISRATVTTISPGGNPEPRLVTVEELASGTWDGQLVRLEGWVEEIRQQEGHTILTVLSPPVLFNVIIPGLHTAERFPRRAHVRLVGAATGQPSDDLAGGMFALITRSAEDVEILSAASFWTHQRAALAAAALAGVCILAIVCVAALRHRVRHQTRQIRQQLEHEVALEARYRDLFEGAGDAVWVTDRDGRLVSLNRAGELLLGLTRDEAIGRPIAEFIPPDEARLARASQVTRLGAPFELTVVPQTGSAAVVEVSSQALPDGGVQTIARNITERKRMLDRTHRVQKLEAIGRLAGGIAHDFNNLLTVINGSAEILRDRLPDGEPARALADEVLDAGNRAANLTRQLLAFSRQRFVAPTALDLNQAVGGTTGLLRRLIGDEVHLVTELTPDPLWVLAETGLVEQVLMNLAVNARDAMPQGGTLTIRTMRAPGGLARLTVTDTGDGMDEATQAKVFEPFFTTKPVGQGTGLGLATVYGVVQTLGGVIRFTSTRGRGTTFEVDLPALAERDGEPAAPTRPDVSDPTPVPNGIGYWGRPYTVLLVEDDEAVRDLAQSVLENQGLTVLTAGDGPSALAVCREQTDDDPLHLLITDVMMPKMTGVELASEALAEKPDLKVLFMSGYTADEVPLTDGPAARWEFVRKPFSPAELTSKVREVLRRTDGMPAAMTNSSPKTRQ